MCFLFFGLVRFPAIRSRDQSLPCNSSSMDISGCWLYVLLVLEHTSAPPIFSFLCCYSFHLGCFFLIFLVVASATIIQIVTGAWFLKLAHYYFILTGVAFIFFASTGSCDDRVIDHEDLSCCNKATVILFELVWSWSWVLTIMYWAINFPFIDTSGLVPLVIHLLPRLPSFSPSLSVVLLCLLPCADVLSPCCCSSFSLLPVTVHAQMAYC